MITKLDQFLNELKRSTYSSAAELLAKKGFTKRALVLRKHMHSFPNREYGIFNIQKFGPCMIDSADVGAANDGFTDQKGHLVNGNWVVDPDAEDTVSIPFFFLPTEAELDKKAFKYAKDNKHELYPGFVMCWINLDIDKPGGGYDIWGCSNVGEYRDLGVKDGENLIFTDRNSAVKFKKYLDKNEEFHANLEIFSEEMFNEGLTKSPTDLLIKIKKELKKIKVNDLYTE